VALVLGPFVLDFPQCPPVLPPRDKRKLSPGWTTETSATVRRSSRMNRISTWATIWLGSGGTEGASSESGDFMGTAMHQDSTPIVW
jgi:hypothetical protein